MKRMIFGFVAVVVAAFAVAFTTPAASSKVTDFTFYYVPPTSNDFSQSSVQNEANWKVAPSPVPSCTGLNKACSIVVDQANTTGSGASRVLDFQLIAMQGDRHVSTEYIPDAGATLEIKSSINRQ